MRPRYLFTTGAVMVALAALEPPAEALECSFGNEYDLIELELEAVEIDGVEVNPSTDYAAFEVTMETTGPGETIRAIYLTRETDVWMERYEEAIP